jgi:prepilin-type N-terminal cleavage/methylation domain-containing protein
MKLLLDENLSRRLVPFLQAEFPDSTQVVPAGLERATDMAIWTYARDYGYVIVTRDADFEELSTIHGCPPRVIWIRGENMSKAAVLNLLLANRDVIEDALSEDGIACVELGSNIGSRESPQTPDLLQRGFTLIELAIVMFIVALLLGGMLLPLSAQQDIRARQETEKNLGEIRDALVGYALVKGYLPCPAPTDLSTGGAEATRIVATGACPSRVGLLPWVTLGLGRADSWNHRYRYSVTPAFANDGTGSGTKMTSNSVGDITISTRDTAGTLQALATNVPVAVVSHGALGAWSYTETGAQIPDSANLNADEDTNGNDALGTSFVSRTPAAQGSAAPGEFDDIVIWLSPNTLFNRMVAAGKL